MHSMSEFEAFVVVYGTAAMFTGPLWGPPVWEWLCDLIKSELGLLRDYFRKD